MINQAANQLYNNLAFTHKIHEKQCELLSTWVTFLKLVSIAVVIIVLLLQFWQITDTANRNLTTWSIYLTIAEVALLAYQLSFNYEKMYDQHRSAAKRALALKNKLLVLKDDPTLQRKTLDEMIENINELYDSAPQTNWFAKFLAEKNW